MSYEDNNPFGDDEDRPAFLNSPIDVNDAAAPNAFSPQSPVVPVFPSTRRVSASFTGRCTRIDQIGSYLDAGGSIIIVDAGKNAEGSGGSFIAYTIRTGELEVRRRYSEFESLRANLARLYPCLIVPPIPEKQSIADYTAGTTKAREDIATIEHRKRMLEQFLRRAAIHQILRFDKVFHRFLDPNVSWSEVLLSPPIAFLPKNILRAPPHNPANAHEDTAYANLPAPAHTSKATKTATDPTSTRFLAVEQTSKDFGAVLSSTLEKTNKRVLKRFSDLSVDYNELGANYNAYSLSESSQTAGAVEKLGQASDETYLAMTNLAYALSNVFSEPLAEQTQMLAIVRQVLRYRRLKITQAEQTSELLAEKKAQLEQMERSESEAKRIDGALTRMTNEDEFPPTHDATTPTTTPSRKSSMSFKFGLGKLNHAIHSLTDTDPALSRRNRIGATREFIASLEVACQNSERDLKFIDETITSELASWEASRREDWRRLTRCVAGSYVEWARKCLESWTEVEKAVDAIPASEYI